jgi:hypothetical protein
MPGVSTAFYLIQVDVTGKTKDFSKYITVIFFGAGLNLFVLVASTIGYYAVITKPTIKICFREKQICH